MERTGGGLGLPQMSEKEMFLRLLSEDETRGIDEPEVASNIGDQMIHMGLRPLSRTIRSRIRDICSRIPANNVILVGGGIGHLSAWLFDLWCSDNIENNSIKKPDSFTIVEEGGKFGIILNRLISRYDADSWSKVIINKWPEIVAESSSWLAANAASSANAPFLSIPLPVDLIIIDLPEDERIDALTSSFNLLSPGGIIIIKEPEVPTGDVGELESGKEMSKAQEKVSRFNKWISAVKDFSLNNSLSFVELTGGTLVVLRRSS
tara:strand:+ start:1709 stop:2497 length:789 start_codon:yes stop_codon:yes gene_type:complete